MPYEEEQLLEKPLDKKKHRNFSQDNLAATNTKQDYNEEEDKDSYTDDWYDESKEKKASEQSGSEES